MVVFFFLFSALRFHHLFYITLFLHLTSDAVLYTATCLRTCVDKYAMLLIIIIIIMVIFKCYFSGELIALS